MKVVSTVLALIVSLVIVGSLAAQDEKKAPENKRPPRAEMGPLGMLLRNLKLTDDQKAKVEELQKAAEPKNKELREKMDKILTADQKKARDDAMKARSPPLITFQPASTSSASSTFMSRGS